MSAPMAADSFHHLPSIVEAAALIRALRTAGLTQDAIARACDVDARTVRHWEAGTPLRQRNDDRLRTLAIVVAELGRTLTPTGVRQWLTARVQALGGRRPVDVLGAGDERAVLDAVHALVEGDYA